MLEILCRSSFDNQATNSENYSVCMIQKDHFFLNFLQCAFIIQALSKPKGEVGIP